MGFLHLSFKKRKKFSLLFQDEFTGMITYLCPCRSWTRGFEGVFCECFCGLIDNSEKKVSFLTEQEARSAYNEVVFSGLDQGQVVYLVDLENSILTQINSSSEGTSPYGMLSVEAAQLVFGGHIIQYNHED